jgi:hypothetical protein
VLGREALMATGVAGAYLLLQRGAEALLAGTLPATRALSRVTVAATSMTLALNRGRHGRPPKSSARKGLRVGS